MLVSRNGAATDEQACNGAHEPPQNPAKRLQCSAGCAYLCSGPDEHVNNARLAIFGRQHQRRHFVDPGRFNVGAGS